MRIKIAPINQRLGGAQGCPFGAFILVHMHKDGLLDENSTNFESGNIGMFSLKFDIDAICLP